MQGWHATRNASSIIIFKYLHSATPMWQLKFWIVSNARAIAHGNIATSCSNMNLGMVEFTTFIPLLLNEKNVCSNIQQPTELNLWDTETQATLRKMRDSL